MAEFFLFTEYRRNRLWLICGLTVISILWLCPCYLCWKMERWRRWWIFRIRVSQGRSRITYSRNINGRRIASILYAVVCIAITSNRWRSVWWMPVWNNRCAMKIFVWAAKRRSWPTGLFDGIIIHRLRYGCWNRCKAVSMKMSCEAFCRDSVGEARMRRYCPIFLCACVTPIKSSREIRM